MALYLANNIYKLTDYIYWLCSFNWFYLYYDSQQKAAANSVHALVYNPLTYMESNRRNFLFCP